MIMDFTKQNYLELHQEVKFDEKIYKTELIDRLENVYVVGNIKLNNLDVLNLNLKLTGTMFLKDSVTLEEINYPFAIDIKEEYEINDEYFKEYYEKEQNILDIMAILWENIVLEVPMHLTKSVDANLAGDGWCLGKSENEDNNIDPRLADLAKLLDEGKE